MAASEPTVELDSRFSSAGASATPWRDVVRVMERAEIFWLSTVRRDGRPHVTPLPAMWLDGALHFCTGMEEQKSRNLVFDSRCILTTGTDRFLSGLDVVLEGSADPVTDDATLRRLAEMWQAKLGWTFEVVGGEFVDRSQGVAGDHSAPTHGAHVFAVAPAKVLAFGKGEPFTQTRYRFR